MSKFRFDPDALGWPSQEVPDMGCPEPIGALQAFVVLRPGIEAIKEVCRLADIQGLEAPDDGFADDVDPTSLR